MATLGAHSFNGLIGPPPKLPELGVVLFTRPGSTNVGGRIQPLMGMESEIVLYAIVTEANRLSTQYGYRSSIGSVLVFTHAGVSWNSGFGYNFLVLGVSISKSNTMPRACGVDSSGSAFDYAPAGYIESRWRLVAVPA